MLHGQRVPSRRRPIYGSGSGFTSQLPEVLSGYPPLPSARAPPPQLASWVNKGLDWGPVNDVPTLQSCIRDLLKRDVSLVKVMQVMLVRRVLPCQRRPLRMWEFNPEGPRTVQHFFGMNARRDVSIILWITNKVFGHNGGCRPRLQPYRYPGK